MLTVNGSSVNGKQIKLIINYYYYYCNYYNYIIIGALDSTRSQHIRAQFWNEGHCESPHISLLQYIYGRPDNPYCLGFTRSATLTIASSACGAEFDHFCLNGLSCQKSHAGPDFCHAGLNKFLKRLLVSMVKPVYLQPSGLCK